MLNAEDPGHAHLQIHPAFDTPVLRQEMIDTAEQHLARKKNGQCRLTVWVNRQQGEFMEMLAGRGYHKADGGRCLITPTNWHGTPDARCAPLQGRRGRPPLREYDDCVICLLSTMTDRFRARHAVPLPRITYRRPAGRSNGSGGRCLPFPQIGMAPRTRAARLYRDGEDGRPCGAGCPYSLPVIAVTAGQNHYHLPDLHSLTAFLRAPYT